MDELHCKRTIEKERPNLFDRDLLNEFGLQELFKEPKKKKKQGRPLSISLREIVEREKGVRMQEIHISSPQKQRFIQELVRLHNS